jgi:hypothetical protein
VGEKHYIRTWYHNTPDAMSLQSRSVVGNEGRESKRLSANLCYRPQIRVMYHQVIIQAGKLKCRMSFLAPKGIFYNSSKLAKIGVKAFHHSRKETAATEECSLLDGVGARKWRMESTVKKMRDTSLVNCGQN